MKPNPIYLRFLSLLHAIENSDELPPMDLEAKRLLEVIAIRYDQRVGRSEWQSLQAGAWPPGPWEATHRCFQSHAAS